MEFKDFNGYTVYEDGRVFSLKTRRTSYQSIEMTHLVDDKGYHKVQLLVGGKQKMIRVHRLVAHLWLDLDLGSDDQVHHDDTNTHNNHYSNLLILSAGEHIHVTAASAWPLDTDLVKQCRKCLDVKSRDLFYEVPRSKYESHSSYCIMCSRLRTRSPGAKIRRQESYNTREK